MKRRYNQLSKVQLQKPEPANQREFSLFYSDLFSIINYFSILAVMISAKKYAFGMGSEILIREKGTLKFKHLYLTRPVGFDAIETAAATTNTTK